MLRVLLLSTGFLRFHLNLIHLGETTYSYLIKQHRAEIRSNINRKKSGKSFQLENLPPLETPAVEKMVGTTDEIYETIGIKEGLPWWSKI